MKKIVPFNNVLTFSTDVKEITAISLEHEINKYSDMISGVFYVTGEYKITDGQLDREKFNFELPFDIALSQNYNVETLLVDIDDFRYDIISDKDLKVNIDLYIDGEVVEVPLEREVLNDEFEKIDIRSLDDDILAVINDNEDEGSVITDDDILDTDDDLDDVGLENVEVVNDKRLDLLNDMLNSNKEEEMDEELNINIKNDSNNDNDNVSTNIFNPKEEEYVTYRVYKVVDGDTLDSILTRYNVTKEMLADYNNIENIVPGDKLIIPTNEK